jgi:hypothetical protein
MKLHSKLLLLSVAVLASSCNVFNLDDVEGTRGRGAKAFDPYASSASGAISLSLLGFNGCAILPNGEPVTRGSLTINYPALCQRLESLGGPLPPPSPPSAQLTVTPGELYFLREFTVVETIINEHKNFNDRNAPATWIRKQSRFKKLDWSGLTVGRDDWRASGTNFQRETFYENAAWMLSNDDTFLVEVLDAGGVVRASETYTRKDFLAENSITGRTRVSWLVMGLSPPTFPGDPTLHPAPGQPQTFQTIAKASFVGSTNPFKAFRMPDLTGEGVIRVTWSLMNEDPFLFPVTFLKAQERQPTCYKLGEDGLATQEQVPCGFGLKQQAHFNTPQNGKYYMPGEVLDFMVSMQDGDGNSLHSRDLMPSYNEFRGGASNGFAYFNLHMLFPFRDASSSESGYKVVGPLQDLQVVYGTYSLPYFAYPQRSDPKFYLDPGWELFAGGGDIHPSTRHQVPLPADAKPGTYAVFLKGHRYFMGERLNRLEPFFFQVGQEQPTTYSGSVGNCQICHNGVNSLNNLHHGMAVDHVEACKTCHTEETVGFMPDIIHRLHVSSRKYSQNKGNCTVCHLKRESTLRPSIMACNGCHLSAHGSEFFDLEFQQPQNTPNAYGNCAQSCHAANPPAEHILPGN